MPFTDKYTKEAAAKKREALRIAREIQKKTDAAIEKYLSNPKLKASGAKVSFTQKQIDEYQKCKADPVYFIERYVKIVNLDLGLVQIKLYPEQKEMVKLVHGHQKSIIKAARQVGKTTTLGVGYILYYILFHSDKKVGILANKEITAQEILNRVKIAYQYLPLWIQQGVAEWNKTSILLDNNSGVICASTSSSAIRGWSINFLYLDEFAFVPFNIATEFFASVYPTITSGKTTKMVITSTPKGLNQFYNIYRGAELGPNDDKWNGFYSASYDWRVVPWRDEAWANQQRALLGDEMFDQEYMCEFHGSSGTLISGKFLRSMGIARPIKKLMNTPNRDDHKLLVYRDPVPGRNYILCADTSHGKELDDSAFCVIDITEAPYYVVARYADNSVSPLLYPSIIASTGRHYNNAWVLGENNDVGAQILYILTQECEYENVIYVTDKNQKTTVGEIGGKMPGVRTTSKVKRQGCLTLKTLIESASLITEDAYTIEQFGTFIMRPNRTYAADDEKRDDLVMTLVIFAWLTNQEYFKDLTNTNFRQQLFDAKAKLMEADMPPVPVIRAPNMQQQIPGIKGPFFREGGDLWEIVGDPDNEGAITPEMLWEDEKPWKDDLPDFFTNQSPSILPRDDEDK